MAHTSQVTIYTTATCAYCKAEKEFLHDHKVAYDEVPVDVDETAAEAMIKLSGQMGVPFTVVAHDGDTPEEHIVGFDQPRIAAALGL
jgi:glutaredoxin 3